MSKPKTIRFTIDLAADLAGAVNKAAAATNMTAEELIGDYVAQHCETALRAQALPPP